jgi:pyruvate formate lyase activating enzyme
MSRALPMALSTRTRAGVLFEQTAHGALKCTACAHRCVMDDGRTGACGVRTHRGGTMQVPHGYVARKYVRAVESNTIYHVRPGARALTFGMFGCDLRCPYCHNWRVSQALRDDNVGEQSPTDIDARALVDEAIAEKCEVLCSAYNEPMITAEWAHEIFSLARARGLITALITDGHSTPEALAYMRPVTDVFRVDLKGWTPEHYKSLGGRLEPVLESIVEAKRLGYWVELVTLVVPGFNDDERGLALLAERITAIDPKIPWHLDGFVPRYKLRETPATAPMQLAMAAGAAYARGLKFVYVGNIGDAFPELSSTRCPKCERTLIERSNWEVTKNTLVSGACVCGEAIPGVY